MYCYLCISWRYGQMGTLVNSTYGQFVLLAKELGPYF